MVLNHDAAFVLIFLPPDKKNFLFRILPDLFYLKSIIFKFAHDVCYKTNSLSKSLLLPVPMSLYRLPLLKKSLHTIATVHLLLKNISVLFTLIPLLTNRSFRRTPVYIYTKDILCYSIGYKHYTHTFHQL
jgi:hypothetical protein